MRAASATALYKDEGVAQMENADSVTRCRHTLRYLQQIKHLESIQKQETRRTQNLAKFTLREGSTPSSATNYPFIYF